MVTRRWSGQCLALRGLQGVNDIGHVCFEDQSSTDDFVENEVNLVHVKDEVEFADVLEAGVERFDEDLNEVEDAQLALARVHDEHEEQGGVVAVDDAHVGPHHRAALHEVAHPVGAPRQQRVHLAYELLLRILADLRVELGEARLPAVVQHHHGLDHGVSRSELFGCGMRLGWNEAKDDWSPHVSNRCKRTTCIQRVRTTHQISGEDQL